ncbi:hypothetical protein BB561_005519 [Smittium simulii]|uniref:Uncharacterized protein n=1 Tax=Smittium simulii TaxID=133385 RepID=A0A2T9YA08_9FUNG|nr:hypothetical protein BB561_005519 [Smittium simulii]
MIVILAVNSTSTTTASSIVRVLIVVAALLLTILAQIYFEKYVNKKFQYLDSVVDQNNKVGWFESSTQMLIEMDINTPDYYTKEQYDYIYKDGYALLEDENYKEKLLNTCFKDTGYTTIWAPKIDEEEMLTLYQGIDSELEDKGTITVVGTEYQQNGKLRVLINKAPEHLS